MKFRKTTRVVAESSAIFAELLMGSLGLLALIVALLIEAPEGDEHTYVILLGIGSSLIASAFATWILEASRRRLNLARLGLIAIFERRAEVHEGVYQSLIKGAKRRIWVQGTRLNRFLQKNEKVLEEAAKRGVDVRILILSSQATVTVSGTSLPLIECRQREENRRAPVIPLNPYNDQSGIINFAAKVNKEIETSHPLGQPIAIREYCTTTGNMIFVIDDTMFAGPYLHCADSGGIHTMQLTEGPIFSHYEQHFQLLWEDERFSKPLA